MIYNISFLTFGQCEMLEYIHKSCLTENRYIWIVETTQLFLLMVTGMAVVWYLLTPSLCGAGLEFLELFLE